MIHIVEIIVLSFFWISSSHKLQSANIHAPRALLRVLPRSYPNIINFRLFSAEGNLPFLVESYNPVTQPPGNGDGSSYMPLFQRWKRIFGSDGKTIFFSKENVAKLGLNALLAYGFVSNVSYITCLIISWVMHGKATGLSPRSPGQWKTFLGIYAGLWAANNLLRPLRFSLSILITPLFDKFIDFVVVRTGFKRPTGTIFFRRTIL